MSTIIPKISVLTPLVTRILGCNPGKFTLQGTNTYLIGSGKRRILLDTGDGNQEYTQLLIRNLNDTGIEISTILLSHWHIDHIGGVSGILSHTSDTISVYKYPGEKDGELRDSWKADPIKDGQEFVTEDGSAKLVAYFTPGHAVDHVVFYLVQEDALFSGDNVLGEGSTVFNDLSQYINSLNRMIGLCKKQKTRIYPGHGPLIEDAIERINVYIQHRQDREDEILHMLYQQPFNALTIEDLSNIMYKDVAPDVVNAAQRVIGLHLNKLLDESKVIEKQGHWSLINHETKL